jgi:hypothetical protein
MPEYGDTLVALLHIEVAQILITNNGIPNALVQMGGAERDPFGGKFAGGGQQRTEVGGEGGDTTGGFGANDPLRGNLQQTQIPNGGNTVGE